MNILDANLVLFVAASLALIATPGQDNVYILTRGIAQGRTAALVSALGVSAGVLVHTAFAAVGLSAILASSALAFSVVKYAGAAYLVSLGLRMVLSREGLAIAEGDAAGRRVDTTRKLFLQGLASCALNPKVALFFLAFLPQFASAGSAGGARLQFLFLGLLYVALTLVVTSLLALFSGAVGNPAQGEAQGCGRRREGRRRRACCPGRAPGPRGRSLAPRRSAPVFATGEEAESRVGEEDD
ncbi:MAG: LysE family translocator [Actinomycetota bacterium]|nr:LysE family translocator [Actinomycetota bacterium]